MTQEQRSIWRFCQLLLETNDVGVQGRTHLQRSIKGWQRNFDLPARLDGEIRIPALHNGQNTPFDLCFDRFTGIQEALGEGLDERIRTVLAHARRGEKVLLAHTKTFELQA